MAAQVGGCEVFIYTPRDPDVGSYMRLWPFGGSKAFLDNDDETWQLETWGWLRATFGVERMCQAPLVTTDRSFFPPTDAKGPERAQHIFDTVKALAGMADWPCTLLALPERPDTRVSELGRVKIDSGAMPLGTFSRNGNSAVITYDPGTIGRPATLVATLIHELAHYLLHSAADLPPGGHEMEEFATDLTTVYLGFGLFGANQAFTFSQFRDVHSQGWSTTRQGYLRERDWAFALAVFCALRREDIATLQPWLKPHLYIDVRAAARHLSTNESLLASL